MTGKKALVKWKANLESEFLWHYCQVVHINCVSSFWRLLFLSHHLSTLSLPSISLVLAEHKNKGGNVIDIKHDIKLRRWTFSIIRKLSTHGIALEKDKLRLIEGHKGLKECLLDEQHVAAACAECQRREEEKELMAAPSAAKMANWNAKLESECLTSSCAPRST